MNNPYVPQNVPPKWHAFINDMKNAGSYKYVAPKLTQFDEQATMRCLKDMIKKSSGKFKHFLKTAQYNDERLRTEIRVSRRNLMAAKPHVSYLSVQEVAALAFGRINFHYNHHHQ